MTSATLDDDRPPADPAPRRSFLAGVAATLIGGLVVVFPFLAGLAVLADPLRRNASATGFVRITSLLTLPADGLPRSYPVLAERVDAWNRFAAEPIGRVHLRRVGPSEVHALNAECPHAGCLVPFLATEGTFQCPCHKSQFAADGTRIDPESCPSPRDLDPLEVEIRDGDEVWVRFQNFRAGQVERIPIV